MAHVLKAYLFALATEPQATARAAEIVTAARSLPMDERERSHLEALDHLLAGNWTVAALALDFHGACYPRDLLALQAGHLMDFFRASARGLRDRIARALPQWSASTPSHGVVARHVRLRARGDRRLCEGGGPRTAGHRCRALRLLGASRRGARDGDAGARPGRHRLDDRSRALLGGRRQLLQGSQLVAPGPLPPRPRAGTKRCSSTTGPSVGRAARSRSISSTPRRSCGACT